MAVGFRYLIYAFTWLGIGFFVLVPVLGGLLYGVADTAST
jgi:hypothetical protein